MIRVAVDAMGGDHAPQAEIAGALQALTAFPYTGFWSGMVTFKDRQRLEEMHDQGQAVWEVWKHQARPPVRQLRAL